MRSYSTAWAASSAQRGERRTREDCHHGEREAVSEGNVAENMTVPRKADRANRLDYKALRRRILARVDCGEPAGSPQAALRRRMLARVGSGEPAGSPQASLRRRMLARVGSGEPAGWSPQAALRRRIRAWGALGRGWGGFAETDARSAGLRGGDGGGFVFRKAACGDRGDDCRRRSVKAACGGLAEALGRGWWRGYCFSF